MRSRSALTSPTALLSGLCLALLTACGPASGSAGGSQARASHSAGTRAPKSRMAPARTSDVAAVLRAMTLPQKVGQLFVSAVPGTAAGQGGAALVRRYHL